MRKVTLILGMLCLFSITYAQKELTVDISKESNVTNLSQESFRMNPFMEEAGLRMVQHPTIPYVYTIEQVEEPVIINKRNTTKGEGCDATLTYVGHDNEWATIPESWLPQTFQFYGNVTNNGTVDLTNVMLKVTVYNSSHTSVFTATSDPVALLELGEEVEITVDETFDFTVKDKYYIAYEVIHDCDEPGNNGYDNLLYRWVHVSDNVMAKFTDNVPINTSNFIFGEGNIGILFSPDRDEILTGISYKTYSASAANPARGAVYEVEVEDDFYEVGEWVLNEETEEWEFIVHELVPYTNIVGYELIAKSDDAIPMKFEALHDYYLPIDRQLDNPINKGVKLEAGKHYVIASDGNMVQTANTKEYNKQILWGKANVGDNQDFQMILANTLAMVRMHFGEEELLPNVDAGVKEIIRPRTTHAIPSMFTVQVDVKNWGKQPIESGLTVYYQYNDEPVVEKVITATIQPFQTLRVTFDESLNLYKQETAILKVWTELSGDENPDNDMIESEIEMVNPNYTFNFEMPDWNFYSWNTNPTRNRFAPWTVVDEDNEPVKSIVLANNYAVQWGTMGASFGGGNSTNSGRRTFQGLTPSLTSPTLEDYIQPISGKKIGWVASPAGQAKDWIISPKVKLNTNSYIEFWAMALDGGTNVEKLKVLVSTSDEPIYTLNPAGTISTLNPDALITFVPVSGESEVTIPKTWTKFEYDLSEYDEQEVYVAIYYCSNNQLFAVFDDIRIKTDFVDFTDLEVVSVTKPTNITEKDFVFTIRNKGNKPVVDDLSFSYQLNGGDIVTYPFTDYPINTGVSKTITFQEEVDLPVGIHTFKIWVNYEDDNNRLNDTLIYKVEINPLANPLKLTFEEFIDFSENFYPWQNLDIDKSLSYNLGNPYNPLSYFKEWMPIGFIAFNPWATIPPSINRFEAFEGNKFGASIRVWNPTNASNDWLISPKAAVEDGFNYVTMMVKSSYPQDLETFNVLVSTTNTSLTSFTPLNEEALKAPAEWTEVAFQLNDYISQEIHVAVQSVSVTEIFYGQMFMIDNVEIVLNEEYKTESGVTKVLSVSSYPKLPFTDIPVKVIVANTGNQDVLPVSVSMQLNDGNIITEDYDGDLLVWKQKVEFEFEQKIDFSEPGINVLKVWVNYDNRSSEPFEHIIYINEPQNSMFIDFEDAFDFTTVLLPWSNIDVDDADLITFSLQIEGITYPLRYPGYNEHQSFVVFNPSATAIPNLINYIRPKSGDRIAISVRPVTGSSNDWFISPKIALVEEGDSRISFFARGLAAAYPEKFNVLVSTTDMEPESFVSISGSTPVSLASSAWTENIYSLNDYRGQEVYVAIQCVTDGDGAMFMLDDIMIETGIVGINSKNFAGITVSPNPSTGKLSVNSSELINSIEIIDAAGQSVLRERINANEKTIDISKLKPGLYFVRINGEHKTEVVKILKK